MVALRGHVEVWNHMISLWFIWGFVNSIFTLGHEHIPSYIPLKKSLNRAVKLPSTQQMFNADLKAPFQDIPNINKLEYYDDCSGEVRKIDINEMILITSNPSPDSYTCNQVFKAANVTSVLEVHCYSLKLRFTCQFESLEFKVDSRTYNVCRDNATPVKLIGQTVVITYKRKLFGVHGGYTCSIVTTSIVHPASLVSPCGISLLEQEQAIRSSLAPRVTNGEEVKKNKYPWMAIVKMTIDKESYTCGGTLISTNAVLTAAHCLTTSKEVKVGLGTLKSLEEESDGSMWRTSSNFSIYPTFDQINVLNDIAIIFLPEPITFTDKILPICLPTFGYETDLSEFSATVLGWGALFYGGPVSNKLQRAEISIWTKEDCRDVWKRLSVNIKSTQLCALSENSDTCTGDSGGPLMIKTEGRWVLVGITSYGYECSTKGLPGVYTRVSEFTSWITDMVTRT